MGNEHSNNSISRQGKPGNAGDDFSGFDPDRAFAEIRSESDVMNAGSTSEAAAVKGPVQEILPIPEPVESSSESTVELAIAANAEDSRYPDTTPPESSVIEDASFHAESSISSIAPSIVSKTSQGGSVTMSADDLAASEHEDFETVKDPRIPASKQFFKIGEVSKITGLKPYVLRYWETEFSWVKPTKTSSRQRMYRRADVVMLLRIKRLRYQDHHTIASAREIIKESRRQERKAKAMGSRKPVVPRMETSKSPAKSDKITAHIAAVANGAKNSATDGNQLGLGLPSASKTAELARKLSEMRRTVLEMVEVIKE
ncbi:MAG: MerR family transcriptional regulator [Myxococcota bacterium]|nr:MerR family transcriptional regulator [Myxococcota bacterium]